MWKTELWKIISAAILGCIGTYTIIILYCYFSVKRQSKDWNKGFASNGKKWILYNKDSKGRRYYVDESRRYICRISWPEVDRNYKL